MIEKDRHPTEAEARRKAETILARLKKNENIATLARAESEGPSSVRGARAA